MDKIVDPNDYDWDNHSPTKGKSRYSHLWDGKARELDMRDYGHHTLENFRLSVTAAARNNGYKTRSLTLDDYTILFQVTGKR